MNQSERLRIVLLIADENLSQDLQTQLQDVLGSLRPVIVSTETQKKALTEVMASTTHLLLCQDEFPGGNLQSLVLSLSQISGETLPLCILFDDKQSVDGVSSFAGPIANWRSFKEWIFKNLPDQYRHEVGLKLSDSELSLRLSQFASQYREAPSTQTEIHSYSQFSFLPPQFRQAIGGESSPTTRSENPAPAHFKGSMSREQTFSLIIEVGIIVLLILVFAYSNWFKEDTESTTSYLLLAALIVAVFGFFSSRFLARWLQK